MEGKGGAMEGKVRRREGETEAERKGEERKKKLHKFG